jgi:hypothetical protein
MARVGAAVLVSEQGRSPSLPAALIVLLCLLALSPLAAASPPDPVWIGEVYDRADQDEVVDQATSLVAVVELRLILNHFRTIATREVQPMFQRLLMWWLVSWLALPGVAWAQTPPFALCSISFPLIGNFALDDNPGCVPVAATIQQITALGANDVMVTISAGAYDSPTANVPVRPSNSTRAMRKLGTSYGSYTPLDCR